MAQGKFSLAGAQAKTALYLDPETGRWGDRLAPLYDVASSLPYDDMYLPRLRLAMKIGSEYRVEAITGRHWRDFAERNRLDAGRVLERITELARRLPEASREASSADAVVALGSSLPERLVARVTEHARDCAAALGKG